MPSRMQQDGLRPTQVLIILGATLALFLVVAFSSKAVEAHRLRQWQAELESEIAAMERERDAVAQELERRQNVSWLDERLRQAGLVPAGVVSVIPVPVVEEPVESTMGGVSEASVDEPAERTAFFDNPRWEAWVRLIFGFDEAR